jgi:hypothetical protein
MLNKVMQAVVITMLSACEPPASSPPLTPAACDPAMREWILQCIEKANPHSDEEPEDNTKQCERTATHLFCGPTCFLGNDGRVWCQAPKE